MKRYIPDYIDDYQTNMQYNEKHIEELYLLERLEKAIIEEFQCDSIGPSLAYKYNDILHAEAKNILNRGKER